MNLIQSNIFECDFSQENTLVIIFGYIGFNEMSISWRDFSRHHREFNKINNPFNQMPNEPIQLATQGWFWFVPTSDNHGIPTDELEKILNNIFTWVKNNSIYNVITNGVKNINHGHNTQSNRESDDERVRYIIKYMTRVESNEVCKITLTSRNDAFSRNQP